MRKQIGALLVAALPSVAAMAQENAVALEARDVENLPFGQPGWQASVNTGYDWGGEVKFQGARPGNSDAFNFNIGAGTRVPLNDQWSLQFGFVSDNFYLEQIPGTPIPDAINTLRVNAGAGVRLDDKWAVTALFSPTLYRLDDVDRGQVGFSGSVVAAYHASPTLNLIFGIVGSPDSDVAVLPILGLTWRLDDHYLLELGVPKTRMSYFLEKEWALYAGANLNGTIFRADEHLGNQIGLSQYNNALGYYRDIRVGAGTSYELVHGLRAEIEGGYSVYRDLEYTRVDQNVRFEPSPYIRLALSLRF